MANAEDIRGGNEKKTNKKKNKNGPPERWEDYSNMGCVIQGSKFLAFKVPLKEELCRKYRDQKLMFTPEDLLQETMNENQLGLIIDLTYTCRYYCPSVFQDQCIQYEKIFVPGHVIPSQQIFTQFYTAVDEFLQDSDNKDKFIGVHCTHGVNRTGYFICRYMIEKMGFEPEDAIKAFNEARGHKIERENYLKDLRRRPLKSDEDTESETTDAEHQVSNNDGVHRRESTNEHDDNVRWQEDGSRKHNDRLEGHGSGGRGNENSGRSDTLNWRDGGNSGRSDPLNWRDGGNSGRSDPLNWRDGGNSGRSSTLNWRDGGFRGHEERFRGSDYRRGNAVSGYGVRSRGSNGPYCRRDYGFGRDIGMQGYGNDGWKPNSDYGGPRGAYRDHGYSARNASWQQENSRDHDHRHSGGSKWHRGAGWNLSQDAQGMGQGYGQFGHRH